MSLSGKELLRISDTLYDKYNWARQWLLTGTKAIEFAWSYMASHGQLYLELGLVSGF